MPIPHLSHLPQHRFWGRVARSNSDDCWPWQGATERGGYGKYTWRIPSSRRTITRSAHRIAYELLVGPIPEGLTLDHLCRNRACANPSHLEAVTMRENTLRGETFPARNAAKTHCPRGHPYDAANTYVNPSGSRTCRACTNESSRKWKERNHQHVLDVARNYRERHKTV